MKQRILHLYSIIFLIFLTSCNPTQNSLQPTLYAQQTEIAGLSKITPTNTSDIASQMTPISASTETVVIPAGQPTITAQIQYPNATLTASKIFELNTDQKNYWTLTYGRIASVGFDNLRIYASEIDPNQIYFLSVTGFLSSVDGGITWTDLGSVFRNATKFQDFIEQVEPDRTKSGKFYVIANGQIWNSPDLGKHWQMVNDQFRYLSIALTSDSQVIYAVSDKGMLSSNDGGLSWKYQFPSATGNQINIVVTDAKNPAIAYAINNGRLLVTNSSGKDWTTPSMFGNTTFEQILADKGKTGLAYGVTKENSLYKTTDGGNSWGIIADLNGFYRNDSLPPKDGLLLDARNGTIIASSKIAYEIRDPIHYCGDLLMVSNDQGANWEKTDLIPPLNYPSVGVPECGKLRDALLNPTLDGRISVMTTYGWISTKDWGKTWDVKAPAGTIDTLSVGKDGKSLYTNGSRISRSDDGGVTWSDLTMNVEDYKNSSFTSVTQQYDNGLIAYSIDTAFPKQAFIKTEDGGNTWKKLPISFIIADSPRYFIVDPWDAMVIFMGSGQVQRDLNDVSRDGGVSWTPLTGLENHTIRIISFQPQSPGTLYFGTDHGLFKSLDSGKTFQVVGLGSDFDIQSIGSAIQNPKELFVIAISNQQIGLYKTEDEGNTWNMISNFNNFQQKNNFIYPDKFTWLAIDPGNSSTFFAALGGTILKSTDGGKNWKDWSLGLSSGEHISQFLIGNSNPPVLYALGINGVWRLLLK